MRHIRAATAAFATKLRHPGAYQRHGIKAFGQVVGHRHGKGGAPLIDRRERGNAAAELRLHVIQNAAQGFGVDTFQGLAKEFGLAQRFDFRTRSGAPAPAKRQLLLRLCQFGFQTATLGHKCANTLPDLFRRGFQHLRGLPQHGIAPAKILPGRFPGQRLDTAHTAGNGAFADDLEQGDIAKRIDMGAAAQLDRIMLVGLAPHGKYADLIAIFFTEQRQRAGLHGILRRHQPRGDGLIGANFLVHFRLDRRDVLIAQRGWIGEIEPQPLGCDQAAFLRHMAAKAIAQRGVQQMRRAMVGAQAIAPLAIHQHLYAVTKLQAATVHHGVMGVQPPQWLGRVRNGGREARRSANAATVAHLATGFGVERGLVSKNNGRVTLAYLIDFLTVLDQPDNRAFAFGRLIADELAAAFALGNVEPDLSVRAVAGAFPGRARRLFLLRHGRIETGAIDRQAACAQGVLGQIIGEAIGIVELERGFSGKLVALLHRSGGVV